jgi:ABC-type multidrug transport system fused ATPase/permease subunit
VNTFLFLGVALFFLARGNMLFGDLMAAFYYSLAVVSLFTDLGRAFTGLQSSYASIMRIRELEALPAERSGGVVVSAAVGAAVGGVAGAGGENGADPVSFESVDFSYDGTTPVLKGLSFRAAPNEILVIRGQSGTGKSTIFKLLLGLYECSAGTIRLYGKDIRSLSLKSLRNACSYVSQEPLLFRGSVFENIAAAKEGASLEEVMEAAKKAAVHDVIEALPEQYGTDTGEKGKLLSGGQRQRIALARVFLQDSPILLLDEPVSAADSLSAGAFYGALDGPLREKTVLLISHRSGVEDLFERFKGRIRAIEL